MRLREPRAKTPAPDDDFWYNPLRLTSQAGVKVDGDIALKISTVYACVKVLAESVAMLPPKMYQRRTDGGKDEALNHPLYDVLHDQPNASQTSFDYREMMMGHLLLRGNAHSRTVPGPRGFADQLVPLYPPPCQRSRLRVGWQHY
jgi:HK97 family phage portal protein